MTRAPEIPVFLWRDGLEPAAELNRLRTEAPITRIPLPEGGSAWLVTRYADVREVLSDPAVFSNANPVLGMRAPDEPDDGRPSSAGFLLAYDPPEHTRFRRMLAPEFAASRLSLQRPRIEAIVTDHLDRMERSGGPIDLVPAFALPVPSLVICELLGVPYEERREFQDRSHKRLDPTLSYEEMAQINGESRAYMAGLVKRQRENPEDNLLGRLIRRFGDDVLDEELVGICDLLLMNGHESTATFLALGTLLLLQHPGQLARLRDDPDITELAVEELLRYLSAVNTVIPRLVMKDVTIAGQLVKSGEQMFCSLTAANHDETLGADIDKLDISRTGVANVAFGHGVHYCVGAPLGRLEMQIALPALLQRFPDLRLAVPFDEIPFRKQSFIYGVDSLPVEW